MAAVASSSTRDAIQRAEWESAWHRHFREPLPQIGQMPQGHEARQAFAAHQVESQAALVQAFRQFVDRTPLDHGGIFRCIFLHNPSCYVTASFGRGSGRPYGEVFYFFTAPLPEGPLTLNAIIRKTTPISIQLPQATSTENRKTLHEMRNILDVRRMQVECIEAERIQTERKERRLQRGVICMIISAIAIAILSDQTRETPDQASPPSDLYTRIANGATIVCAIAFIIGSGMVLSVR